MEFELKSRWGDEELEDDDSVIVIKIWKIVLFCIEYRPAEWFAVGILNIGFAIYFN